MPTLFCRDSIPSVMLCKDLAVCFLLDCFGWSEAMGTWEGLCLQVVRSDHSRSCGTLDGYASDTCTCGTAIHSCLQVLLGDYNTSLRKKGLICVWFGLEHVSESASETCLNRRKRLAFFRGCFVLLCVRFFVLKLKSFLGPFRSVDVPP